MRANLTIHNTSPGLLTLALGYLLITTSGCVAGDVDETSSVDENPVAEAAQAITYNGHDYLFFSGPNTWDQAVYNCVTNGYYLVIVNDSSEQNWLFSQVKPKGGSWWVDYNDRAYEGNWIGRYGFASYKNWGANQPDMAGPNEMDCANMSSVSGYWYDRGCAELHSFICEK